MDVTVDPRYNALGSAANPTPDADHTELYTGGCRWADGNPNTVEDCNAAYCAPFAYGIPTGTNHDQAAWSTQAILHTRVGRRHGIGVLAEQSRHDVLGRPMPTFSNAAACGNANLVNPAVECTWFAGTCMNVCATHAWANPGNVTNANNQRTACQADARCVWDQSQFQSTSQAMTNACHLKYPINDCQACKRWERTQESVTGLTGTNGVHRPYRHRRGGSGLRGHAQSRSAGFWHVVYHR